MKGITIPYIIAIILGIAVIALIGYWFFFSGKIFGGTIQPGCDEIKQRYCQEYRSSDFSVKPVITKWKTDECGNEPATPEAAREFCK